MKRALRRALCSLERALRRALCSLERALRRALVRYAPRLAARRLALDTAELGVLGEELAARALRAQGWTLVGRRVQTGAGEVDVLARRGGIVAVVEVKAGRLAPERLEPELDPERRPGRRVDAARLARLRRAAARVSRSLGVAARVDLVEVVLVAGRRPLILHHRDVRHADLLRLHGAARAPPRNRMGFTRPGAAPDGYSR